MTGEDTLLSVSLSTQVYKWGRVNLCWGITLQWTSIPFSREDKRWHDGSLGSYAKFTYKSHAITFGPFSENIQEFSHSQHYHLNIFYQGISDFFHVFLVGGRDDATELSSAECYDPKTNQWFPVVAMNSRRSGVGLAVVNGQLLAVGGFDGTTYLKTIEVFDPVSNQWKLYGGMNYRRLGGGVGVVKLPLRDAFGC